MSGGNYEHYGVPDSSVSLGERFICEGSSGGPRLNIGLDGSVKLIADVLNYTQFELGEHQVYLEEGDLTFKWPDRTEAEVHIEPDPGRAHVAFWYVKFYNVACEWLDQPMMYVGYNAITYVGDEARDGLGWLTLHDDFMARCQVWNAPGAVMVQLGLDRDKLVARVEKTAR